MPSPPKPTVRPCRLIVDGAARGSWNMALDEALLHTAPQCGQWTLRFYQWEAPTLSLGYFQPYAERASHAASAADVCVRRSTGGGAILHDRELTYSVAAPLGDRIDAEWLYFAFHETLIDTLAEWRAETSLQPRDSGAARDEQPFLCFLRRTRGDVLLGLHAADGGKIAGSAQRRHRGAVLQHGSVLLDRSPSAPELLGVNQTVDHPAAFRALLEAWLPRLADRLHLQWLDAPIDQTELDLAKEIEQTKFGAESWTRRR